MSKRKNRTNRAAAALGLNPYGWGNGGTRKRPREVRTAGRNEDGECCVGWWLEYKEHNPVGQMEKLSQPNYKGNFGGMQDEKTVEAKN